jgi:cytochrome P450
LRRAGLPTQPIDFTALQQSRAAIGDDEMSTPAHVPAELVVDFDFYRPEGSDVDPFMALHALREGPEVFWTPRNGGHWVVTRGEDIRHILTDHETFSSRHVFVPAAKDRPPTVPLEIDPPDHEKYRRLIMPAFAPPAIAAWTEEARNLAVSLIDGFYARGECEFIGAFAQQLPMIIFLKMAGLPLEHREMLVNWVSTGVRPGSVEKRQANRENLNGYIHELIARRRADDSGEDIISHAFRTGVEGRPLNDDEAWGLCNTMLGGGLDTVATSMGWVALFLARNPGHRQQLVEDPGLIPKAIDELLRRFSIPTIARVVRNDMTYRGVALKQGEQVLMPACLQALDEVEFERPLEVDFRRPDARMHCTFSQGVHRCPGSVLAQREIRVFLEEWLKRIPDFQVKAGETVRTSGGIALGVLELPLSWEPERP